MALREFVWHAILGLVVIILFFCAVGKLARHLDQMTLDELECQIEAWQMTGWELVHQNPWRLWRLSVPGGWIYEKEGEPAFFVPSAGPVLR